jgi:hypothetical protein
MVEIQNHLRDFLKIYDNLKFLLGSDKKINPARKKGAGLRNFLLCSNGNFGIGQTFH